MAFQPWQPFGQQFARAFGHSPSSNTIVLDEEFAIAESAPVATPHICSPGPGTLVFTQNDGQFSISSGKLQIPQQATPVFGDLGYVSQSINRTIGMAVRYELTRTGGGANKEIIVGWASSNSLSTSLLRHGIYLSGVNIFFWASAGAFTPLVSTSFADSTSYQIAIVLRSPGSFAFIKGGVFTNWTLLWVDDLVSTAGMFATLNNFTATATEDYGHANQLPSPFNSNNGIATFVNTSLASGNTFTGTADGLAYFEFTQSGSPLALDEIALYYRTVDTNNSWKAYLQRNAGNTAWDFRLDSISLGVPTNRIAVTGVGAVNGIGVIFDGSKHNCFTRNGSTWTKRGSEVNVSFQNTTTGMAIAGAAGTVFTKLAEWARTSSLYNVLDTI